MISHCTMRQKRTSILRSVSSAHSLNNLACLICVQRALCSRSCLRSEALKKKKGVKPGWHCVEIPLTVPAAARGGYDHSDLFGIREHREENAFVIVGRRHTE